MDQTGKISEHTGGPEDGRVLVTGASGFVGGYVIRELLDRGYTPVCLVRDPGKLTGRLADEPAAKLEIVQGDPFDLAALHRAAAGCRAAIHLIGIIEEKPSIGQTFSRVHVEATRNVVQVCTQAGVGRYAHISALGARLQAVGKYHQSKWFAEQLVRQSPLAWTIFRPSLIHGPDGEFMRMMKFLCTARFRQPVMPYFGRGRGLLQPVSVRDVAACFAKCLAMPQTIGQTYELGGPERFTWKDFYDVCALAIAGRRRIKVPVPAGLAKLAARTLVPLLPALLMPYKFTAEQVQMSLEDNVCDHHVAENAFSISLADFRAELADYAARIG